MQHSVYLINRTPSTAIQNKTPYEMLYNHPPNLSSVRVFGCLVYAATLAHNRTKFQPRARQSVLLGIPPHIKGYKLLDINTSQIYISRNAIFYANIFPFKSANLSTDLPIE